MALLLSKKKKIKKIITKKRKEYGHLYSTFNVTQVIQKILHRQGKGYDSTLNTLGQTNRNHLHTSAQTDF